MRTTIYTLLLSGEPGTTPAECAGTVTLNPAPMCATDQACIEWCGNGQIENFLTHGTIGRDGEAERRERVALFGDCTPYLEGWIVVPD